MILFALALTGCGALGSRGGVEEPTVSSITLDLAAPAATGRSVVNNGTTAYACDIQLTLTTRGGGSGDYATIQLGNLIFRRTADGFTYTLPVDQARYTTWFGSTKVNAGQPAVTTTVSLEWTGPFTVQILTLYGTDAPSGPPSGSRGDKQTTTTLACN